MRASLENPLAEGLDGLWLISFGLEFRDEFESIHHLYSTTTKDRGKGVQMRCVQFSLAETEALWLINSSTHELINALTGRSVIGTVIPGGYYFLHSRRIDDDRCLSIDGTFVFADAAARAFFFFDDWALLVIANNRLIRTLFVAHETDLLRVPGDASCLVDVSDSHLDEAFLFKGENLNGSGRADPSAEIAEFLTISDTGHEPRRVKASESSLQEG